MGWTYKLTYIEMTIQKYFGAPQHVLALEVPYIEVIFNVSQMADLLIYWDSKIVLLEYIRKGLSKTLF